MLTTAALALTLPVLFAGDPEPAFRCGLGKEFHAGRRAALRAAVGEGVYLFRGLPATRGYTVFRQDKTFWYLTGVESPDAVLVMDGKSGEEILFLPEPNRRLEGWDGELWDSGDEWVRELTGFEDVRSSDELLALLDERIDEGDTVWTSLAAHVVLAGASDRARPHDRRQGRDPLDGRASRERALAAQLEERFGARVVDCADELAALRVVKTPAEVDAMRRAAQAGARAMVEAIRSTRPELGEWELDALMTWMFRRAGADGPAYHAIVGGGPNSCVLHYSACSRVVRDGEVVLIDYAPELDHYTSDITRTWPANGRFSERQAELYDAVLAAQLAGIAAVRPGGTIGDVERACNAVLDERGFRRLRAHGNCHLIGMEVHDVGDLGVELVPGVAFTIEPGLYEAATGIGVRIEDVVVVTQDGCEVLSRDVPKERAAMEALVAEQGVLDWMDGER